MKELFFSNTTGVSVRYKTDLITENVNEIGKFQIMQIQGLDTPEIHAGMDFKILTSDIQSFKAFAQRHNLKLQLVTPKAVTTIVDYTDYSDSGSITV